MKGETVLTWTLLSDHGNFPRSKKPKCATRYGLHRTWERTWPMKNCSQLKAMNSCPTILILNRPIQVYNFLGFHFHKKPKLSLFIHPTASALLQITNHLLFQVSTRSFLCSFKHWTNSRGNAFSKFVSSSPASLSHSRGIQKMLFVPFCGCYCFVALCCSFSV